MKKKTKIFTQLLLSIFILLLIETGCKKTVDPPTPPVDNTTIPVVTTDEVTAGAETTAECRGTVNPQAEAQATESGFCWGTSHSPDISGSHLVCGSGPGMMTGTLTGLTANVTYYVRAYATNAKGTGYGEEKSFTIPLYLGLFYQGGYIAYFLVPGDVAYVPGEVHGIIASPYNQSIGAVWGCYGTSLTGADSPIIGGGLQNTTDITNGCSTAGIAARLCEDLSINGYNDWYLPSKNELLKLYDSKWIGGFEPQGYWSSTEDSPYNAYYVSFAVGGSYSTYKSDANYVRAVRSF